MREVVAGRILSMRDKGGRVSIVINDDFPREPDFEGPLFVYIDKLAVPLFIDRVVRRTPGELTAYLADIDTSHRAAVLHGLNIYINREEKDTNGDEPCPENLIGFGALIEGGQEGEITDYYANGLNPLFEVRVGGRDILVPFAEELIVWIDAEARCIAFRLPEGLVEVND